MDQKKTDYGNWVPLALMKRLAAIAGALLAGEVLLIVLDGPTALTLLVVTAFACHETQSAKEFE